MLRRREPLQSHVRRHQLARQRHHALRDVSTSFLTFPVIDLYLTVAVSQSPPILHGPPSRAGAHPGRPKYKPVQGPHMG